MTDLSSSRLSQLAQLSVKRCSSFLVELDNGRSTIHCFLFLFSLGLRSSVMRIRWIHSLSMAKPAGIPFPVIANSGFLRLADVFADRCVTKFLVVFSPVDSVLFQFKLHSLCRAASVSECESGQFGCEPGRNRASYIRRDAQQRRDCAIDNPAVRMICCETCTQSLTYSTCFGCVRRTLAALSDLTAGRAIVQQACVAPLFSLLLYIICAS